ncbi:MAG: hypothetical protein K940chlam6_01058 [Chlamydiae bacterium]|nr:hypothetical protein [Chlamydiota bacterium]
MWLERTLDDSAGRRIVIPESFLTADAILCLLTHVFSHLQIHPEKIEKNLTEHIDELALENILMHAVKKGKDRQEIHEKLREDPKNAKELGLSEEEIQSCKRVEIGRAKEQVHAFLKNQIFPFLDECKELKKPFFEIKT